MKLIKNDFDKIYDELGNINSILPVNQELAYNGSILQANKNLLAGKSGIYYIIANNGHGYVGQARDLYDRLMSHLRRANNSAISDSPALHRALANTNLSFKFCILEYTADLDEAEKSWIEAKRTYVDAKDYAGGYNLTPGGQSGVIGNHKRCIQFSIITKAEKSGRKAGEYEYGEPICSYVSQYAAARALLPEGQDYINLGKKISGICNREPISKNAVRIKTADPETGIEYGYKKLEDCSEDIQAKYYELLAE